MKIIFIFLLMLSFVYDANAVFEFDDTQKKSITITNGSPKWDQEIVSKKNGEDMLSITVNKKLNTPSSLTIEEQCILASKTKLFINVTGVDCFNIDNTIQVIKSKNYIHFSSKDPLQFNSCNFIAKEEIILQSDHIKLCGFFKTPKEISFQSRTPQKTINKFVFKPLNFIFDSQCGSPLESSSMYITANINFCTNEYYINCISAESISIYE